MTNIKIVHGDITGADVDAIVNAANPTMLGGGGVDGAIHRAAGPDLLAACRAIAVIDGRRCPVGEARITSAGNLTANYVIHAVGPRYAVDENPADLLASAYSNSLRLARANACRSVAFPAISCGVFGYPHEEAASIAIESCSNLAFKSLDIRFYLFDTGIADIWTMALAAAESA